METPVNRRGFIARGSLLGRRRRPGRRLWRRLPGATAAPPIKRAGGPKLKTSLNAYSFSKALTDQLTGRAHGTTLFDLLEFCAELNFDAIDPTGYFFPGYPKVPSDKYINDFKRRAFQLGLDVSGTGVRNNFASPDKQKRADDVRHVKEWTECAARWAHQCCASLPGPSPTATPGIRWPPGWPTT